MKEKQARGVRNCNPGNIKHGCKWVGLRKEQTDKDFCQFTKMEWGLRALIITLRTYVVKRGKKDVASIIKRWAPAEDKNPTSNYIRSCQQSVGNTMYSDNTEMTAAQKLLMGKLRQFSSDDFKMKNVDEKCALYGLVKGMCKFESLYNLSYQEFEYAMQLI